MDFTPLKLPMAQLKLSKQGSLLYVWCIIRKKKLKLTPEEWVRQHLIHYLVFHKKYPLGLLAAEVEIRLNTQVRRCDLIVYSLDQKPYLLIECKAPEIKLDQKAIHQIMQYNSLLKLPYLCLSNGLQHEIIATDYSKQQHQKLSDFPEPPSLV